MNELVSYYYKNPINNFEMSDYTIKEHQGNSLCGDDIIVFLKIENQTVKQLSFTGNTSLITKAAASFLAELIENKSFKEIFSWSYQTFIDLGFEVSSRRKRAAVITLLATRNALYRHLGNTKKETFEDLLEDE